ncbi:5-formyltetrahydrofolate cyclo-ligase [Jeotgalibacillus sp. S-D1]|uniref:5-formyltetrahydrofolate cyclo-ligase n=1 Tax=Jeotgalibacillus sp. S-D1 TaxID=2552189 RepID=UPI0010594008|nr:5-formyltetrahydrofolate cyclo-ligase [Jeotgalibacillus sp. S-D1]TDL34543.1 5-formyltetrahydrofolate cyclo-ligase [Jeotgalibacillus sp. S-D1]
MNKSELRKEIHVSLTKIKEEDYRKRSKNIHQNLYDTQCWKNAKSIGITISRFPEVDTYGVIEKAWMEGKTVSVPRCIHQGKKLDFYSISSFEEVEPSYFGLLEPLQSLQKTSPDAIDLLIVPGLAYNSSGFRLGYGGGYYDRYLANYYKRKTISLCFKEQIVEHIPVDGHDQPVGMLIGEENH